MRNIDYIYHNKYDSELGELLKPILSSQYNIVIIIEQKSIEH